MTSPNLPWVILLIAGLCEVGWAVGLKYLVDLPGSGPRLPRLPRWSFRSGFSGLHCGIS